MSCFLHNVELGRESLGSLATRNRMPSNEEDRSPFFYWTPQFENPSVSLWASN